MFVENRSVHGCSISLLVSGMAKAKICADHFLFCSVCPLPDILYIYSAGLYNIYIYNYIYIVCVSYRYFLICIYICVYIQYIISMTNPNLAMVKRLVLSLLDGYQA
jgi:hypothetical protein